MREIITGIILVAFVLTSANATEPGNAARKKARARKREGTSTQPSQVQAPGGQVAALRRAIEYLGKTHGERYPKSAEYLNRLAELEKNYAPTQFDALKREALLANPEIDFDQILLVRRDEKYLALPQNSQGNSALKKNVDNEIATLNIRQPNPTLQRLYKPQQPVFVGDLHLHFDAGRLLFSTTSANGSWQVFEMSVDGKRLRQATPGKDADIDSYEGVYLRDERIIFTSSTGFQSVPCVGGKVYVGNLHVMNPDGTGLRRLTFDQDNNWCPTLTSDGRVMYLRWEYTDSAHYFSRVLMTRPRSRTGTGEPPSCCDPKAGRSSVGKAVRCSSQQFLVREISGRPLPEGLRLIEEVAAERNLTRVAVRSFGFEDEGEFLLDWRQAAGNIHELSFHVDTDGRYLDFAPYANLCD